MKLTINPKFRDLIPSPTSEELDQLRRNLASDGCRDPLVVWGDVIVDGHNRYEICTNFGIPFKTVSKEFADDEEAIDWIEKNQLGRRNLTADARKLILGRRFNRAKGKHGGDHKSKGQNEPLINVAEKLAAENHVSPATVKRAGKFAEEADKKPEVATAILRGDKTPAAISAIADMKSAVRQHIRGMAAQAKEEILEATKGWSAEKKAQYAPEMMRQRGELKRLARDICKLPEATEYARRHKGEVEADAIDSIEEASGWLADFAKEYRRITK